MHFSKKSVLEVDPQQKPKCFVNIWKKKKAEVFVALSSNQVAKYSVDLKSEESPKMVARIGETIGCH